MKIRFLLVCEYFTTADKKIVSQLQPISIWKSMLACTVPTLLPPGFSLPSGYN